MARTNSNPLQCMTNVCFFSNSVFKSCTVPEQTVAIFLAEEYFPNDYSLKFMVLIRKTNEYLTLK